MSKGARCWRLESWSAGMLVLREMEVFQKLSSAGCLVLRAC